MKLETKINGVDIVIEGSGEIRETDEVVVEQLSTLIGNYLDTIKAERGNEYRVERPIRLIR